MTNANEELYVHEHFKFGDRAKEIAEFQEHAERVRDAQLVLAARHSSGEPKRVFHTKIHACLAGTLRLLDDRPQNTRHGIFDSQACEELRFTPGHYVRDHRPLGNLGRGRIFTYEASQIGRRATAEEPMENRFFRGE